MAYRETQVLIGLEFHVAWQLCLLLADGATEEVASEGVDIVDEHEVLSTLEAERVHTAQLDGVTRYLDALIADEDLFHVKFYSLTYHCSGLMK